MPESRAVVVGAGRLARVLVRALPPDCAVSVVARRPEVDLPRPVPVVGPEGCAGAAAVFLAVPAEAVRGVLSSIASYDGPDTVVVNVATEVLTPALQREFPSVRVVAAKFVGQAGELERGSPGAVAVSCADDEAFALLERLLGGVGSVVRMDEELVLAVNTLVAEEMVRAEAVARARLGALALPAEVVEVALATMAPGVVRAVASGTAGPFLRAVMDRQFSQAQRKACDVPTSKPSVDLVLAATQQPSPVAREPCVSVPRRIRLSASGLGEGGGEVTSTDAAVGCVGTVVTRVGGGEAPGEIRADVRGTRELLIAYADAPLEQGTPVLIIAVRGPASVDVVEWTSVGVGSGEPT